MNVSGVSTTRARTFLSHALMQKILRIKTRLQVEWIPIFSMEGRICRDRTYPFGRYNSMMLLVVKIIFIVSIGI